MQSFILYDMVNKPRQKLIWPDDVITRYWVSLLLNNFPEVFLLYWMVFDQSFLQFSPRIFYDIKAWWLCLPIQKKTHFLLSKNFDIEEDLRHGAPSCIKVMCDLHTFGRPILKTCIYSLKFNLGEHWIRMRFPSAQIALHTRHDFFPYFTVLQLYLSLYLEFFGLHT